MDKLLILHDNLSFALALLHARLLIILAPVLKRLRDAD
jgi:hypothetical protein